MTLEADQLSSRSDAPSVLVTKLHPPFVPAETVARERLFERMREGRGRRLSLVACPAGFGKSTLLAAWREDESRERPVAWLSLDEGDDDAVVLWAHVIEALCRACPGLERDALSAMVASAPLLEVVLPRLVNELAEQDEIVLVLDDYHRLSGASARDSVAWFVDHLPSSVQLVLSTRTDPALPLGALRAHGQLLELRVDELRFTGEEANEFLNGRLGLGLAAADVDLLVSRTEGWPAGIYLAALSLTGKEDKHGLVAAFDGTSAHVVDFLSSEVLAAYEPDLQRFMLHTSVLERLCAPLCDAVLGRDGSAGALETLARSNLFLIPLDDQRRWFRFHHLFAQILRVELERREPALVPELHRRAFAWHAESGTTDEAIHHAVSAHAYREAGQLIAETWVHYANVGRTTSVLDWLLRFPAETLDADPRLLLVKAWVSALGGREGDMRAAVARVREIGGLEQGPLPDGFASLESSLVVAAGDVRLGRRVGDPRARHALARAGGTRLAVASRPDVGARLGPLLQGRARRRRALAAGDDADRPARGPVDRRGRGDRRPVADRGRARERAGADAPGPQRGRRRARAWPARRRRGRRGAHRATASRWPRTATRSRRCRSSSAASSCAACGHSRSISSTA